MQADITNREKILAIASQYDDLTSIVHLAAQPGVVQSTIDPYIHVQANLMGHLVMLELARKHADFNHLVYATPSSVYGHNRKMPSSAADRVDQPASLHYATKRADELMTKVYVHQYGFKCDEHSLFY